MIVAPIIGSPYGLTINPIMSASMAMFLYQLMNDAIAPNMQNTIRMYRSPVPMPNRNVRNATRIDRARETGNKNILMSNLIIEPTSLSLCKYFSRCRVYPFVSYTQNFCNKKTLIPKVFTFFLPQFI